jgi:hypothetical protein
MTIERIGHPEPEAAWEALSEFITKAGRVTKDEPLSESVVMVMMIGAWVGCRFSAIHAPFALAIAEYGNKQEDMIWDSLREAFTASYIDWLRDQIDTVLHNRGFDTPVKIIDIAKPETADAPITDDDARGILGGLDEFFGKGKADA